MVLIAKWRWSLFGHGWRAAGSVLVTVVGLVMSAYSSSAPGPLAPPDPPVVVAATKAAAASDAANAIVNGAAK